MSGRSAQGILAVFLAALASSAAAGGPLDPGATLCLHPLAVPLDEKNGEERRAAIELRLAEALRAASFEVPDPAAVGALRKRVFDETGSAVDPATGERDQAVFAARQEKIAQALATEFGCDAYLIAGVATVRAGFVNGTASWDGAKQQISSTGRIVLQVLGGVAESGWVKAFSLWLRVLDPGDQEIAFRSAGIETPLQLAVVKDEDLVPEDHWLSDMTRIDAAIQSALGPGGVALREQSNLTPRKPAPAAAPQ
jgi:hypothetical protein